MDALRRSIAEEKRPPAPSKKGGSGLRVARQQLRLVLGDVSELALQSFRDTGMQRASWLA